MKKLICATLFASLVLARATDFYVAPDGDDRQTGTAAAPFATLARAQTAARPAKASGPVNVWLRAGTYYLPRPLLFTPEDSGTAEAPIHYAAAPGATVVVSGALWLELHWVPYRNGIWQAPVPGVREGRVDFDQLFVNGRPLPLARYPNYDERVVNFHGYAADCLSPERARRWAHPETGFLHALHRNEWGSVHYRIKGVDDHGQVILEGGWQNNRSSPPHPEVRFVENIFEELDAPGEWFLDHRAGMLYFMPTGGLDLHPARLEAASLKGLVEVHGTRDRPVRFLSFQGLTFAQTRRTFMEPYEKLLRSDWSIYRGGAVLLEGTEDCSITDSNFQDLGGNALMVSRYNRRFAVSGCRFTDLGASAVTFVGDPAAVRSPTYWDRPPVWDGLDRTPGPKTPDYPADCRVSDCLMHHLGTVEKQVAGMNLSMSARITVSHCSIYDVPRAGINICDGTFGGHVIEFCDVFDTVKETGDHGSFNSWGRDRYWGLKGISLEELRRQFPTAPTWDAVETTVLRNNRWRCDRGWDIDLDDGSTNYRIENNLCLHGGIKNREGFWRTVENNIMVNNTFHPHVWFPQSQDRFCHNLVMAAYRPALMQHWDGVLDNNLFTNPKDLAAVQSRFKTDPHSQAGDPLFINPRQGDYRVAPNSPALRLGLKNFPMDQFGVVSPQLRAEARTPELGP